MITYTKLPGFTIRTTDKKDSALIYDFIRKLADYEKLSDMVIATETTICDTLFGEKRFAEAVIGELNHVPVAFAIFFHNYSTFLSKPGLYLEDLFVLPEYRGKGFGRAMLSFIAKLAIERGCGRMEWAVLDWNENAIKFYDKLGAKQLKEWITERLTGNELELLAREFMTIEN